MAADDQSVKEAVNEPELSIDPETVCFLIIKAREFDVKVDPDDPDSGSNPTDDKEIDILENRRSDPTYAELAGTLEALNDDQLSDLVALTWIGRGDYAKNDWAEAKAQARLNSSKTTADYLLGTPLLGDFLENGFTELGYSCKEVQAEHL
ncbi:DUF3775 domain-containing protein [Dongia sedimenti]|uniref:DUF3775 domain-containing protein n=1 Tax=Dongia sedimenti TaxID=3064282 RepID=A0ABU0YRX2_9PROT|nr:DUF3775 domain-containing protein [Rhodospirillaceae bacterium R-7]